MDWPKVWLIFATYKRTLTSLQTLDTLRDHIKYPNLHWHIADDGSGETDDGTGRQHVQVLLDHAKQWYPEATGHSMSTPPGSFNTGGNINEGIRLARKSGCSFYYLNFDDWARTDDLDLRPAVDVLDTNPNVGMVRLSYWVPGLAGVAHRYDSPRTHGCHIWFRLIRQWCMHNPWERQSYLVSTQPYVAHMRFHDAYGLHPENVNPGEAEVGLGWQYNKVNGEDGPQILFDIGICTTHSGWGHIAARAHDYAEQCGQA